MSRPKRRSLSENLNAPETSLPAVMPKISAVAGENAPHLESLVTLSRDEVRSTTNDIDRGQGRRRSPGDRIRHSYHASLYLPEEAQFALREIALVTRRPKPHDVMLEALADLFERYNKRELADECRRRITSRDKAKA